MCGTNEVLRRRDVDRVRRRSTVLGMVSGRTSARWRRVDILAAAQSRLIVYSATSATVEAVPPA